MRFHEVLHKLIRAGLLIGVSLFFLLPYALPLKSVVSAPAVQDEPLQPLIDSFSISSLPESPGPVVPVHLSSRDLGINLPWLDTHNGNEYENWLGAHYNRNLIEKDLADIADLGITKVRTFCQMESVFHYRNGVFVLNTQNAQNLDDYLSRAKKHNISVICVMGTGNYSGQAKDGDGNMHLELTLTNAGREVYKKAYVAYVQRFKRHDNIMFWELVNEPYSATTWSGAAKALGITYDDMHLFMKEMYDAVKPVAGDTLVGFSDLEEKQQPQYQLYSSDALRTKYIDDCTDVYALHIYRQSAAELADFSSLTGKPKWVLELGGYNYNDPDAVEHPIPGNNELYSPDKNYQAVTSMLPQLVNDNFTLIMPWGFSSNSGMVIHEQDGTHTYGPLIVYVKEQLRTSEDQGQ